MCLDRVLYSGVVRVFFLSSEDLCVYTHTTRSTEYRRARHVVDNDVISMVDLAPKSGDKSRIFEFDLKIRPTVSCWSFVWSTTCNKYPCTVRIIALIHEWRFPSGFCRLRFGIHRKCTPREPLLLSGILGFSNWKGNT
jgi:hypothetical protein